MMVKNIAICELVGFTYDGWYWHSTSRAYYWGEEEKVCDLSDNIIRIGM